MSASVLIALPMDASWARVGTAAIEQVPGTGASMLCLRLCAMAPTLYLSMTDLLALFAGEGIILADRELEPERGHA